jgi:hypothetical protein
MSVRRWVHRGRVLAQGARVEARWIGEAAARERILRAWHPGDRIVRAGDALVLVFARPRRIEAVGPLEPLVGRSLRTFPDPLPSPPAGLAVHVLCGGRIEGVPPMPARLATWFDVPPLEEGHALAPPIRLVHRRVRQPVSRDAFGVGALDAEGEALREALADVGGDVGGDVGPGPATRPPEAPQPTVWDRMRRGISAFFGQATKQSGPIGSAIRTRQERQLSALLERFQGSDLEQALRSAVPLGAGGTDTARHPAWSLPVRAGDLLPSAGPGRARGGDFDASATLYDALREAYEQAADRLLADGEVAKAAFVWANLLKDVDRALDLLEAHGELELAARLALEHDSPARAVRLRLAAGQVDLAVTIAHRNLCFAQAVRDLDDEAARGLRAAWAAHLLRLGRPEGAIEAVWPDPTLRLAAAPWLARVAERDDASGARALVRWAALDQRRATEAFHDRLSRWSVGSLIALGSNPTETLPVAWRRRLARVLLARADEPGGDRKALATFLLHPRLADLQADLPELPVGAEPTQVERVGWDLGTGLPVVDVARLALGWLVAHGEGGARLVSDDGAMLLQIDRPVHGLAVEDSGFGALLLARAGQDRWRLSRLDLRSLAVTPWTTASLTCWARTYRDGRWVVVTEGRLYSIDLSVDDWEWLHEGPPLQGRPVHVGSRDGHVEVFLADVDEQRRHDHRLVFRGSHPVQVGPFLAVGPRAMIVHDGDAVVWRSSWGLRPLAAEPTLLAVACQTTVLLTARLHREGVQIARFERHAQQPTWTILVEGASAFTFRLTPEGHVGFDDQGRVVAFPAHGTAHRVALMR